MNFCSRAPRPSCVTWARRSPRIWCLPPGKDVLELQASAGMYTHLDGPHSRISVGRFKIGQIAHERQPLLTNEVSDDPRISDPDWARREGMVAFCRLPSPGP